jgi:predicted kinase
MLLPHLTDVIDAVRASQAPTDVRTRIVAVDGHGGAGKSSLAQLLSAELGAPVVHTDDFASWDNPLDWWPVVRGDAISGAEPQPCQNETKWFQARSTATRGVRRTTQL